MSILLLTEDPKVVQVCEKYWEQDEEGSFKNKVAPLAKSNNLKAYDLRKLISENSSFLFLDFLCSECKTPFAVKTRAQYLEKRTKLRWERRSGSPSWECQKCLFNKRQEVENSFKSFILTGRERLERTPLIMEELSCSQLISIAALASHTLDTHSFRFSSLNSKGDQFLAPNRYSSWQLIKDLINEKVLWYSPFSSLKSIEYRSEKESHYFDFNDLDYELNHPDPFEALKYVSKKLSSPDFFEQNKEELKKLVQYLSFQECIAYMRCTMHRFYLDSPKGEAIESTLNLGLERFSTGQMHYFIWRAAKNASTFHRNRRGPAPHAVNTVNGNLLRQMGKALLEEWDIAPYERHRDLPQSSLSKVLYNQVLGIEGDSGFNRKLSSIFKPLEEK